MKRLAIFVSALVLCGSASAAQRALVPLLPPDQSCVQIANIQTANGPITVCTLWRLKCPITGPAAGSFVRLVPDELYGGLSAMCVK